MDIDWYISKFSGDLQKAIDEREFCRLLIKRYPSIMLDDYTGNKKLYFVNYENKERIMELRNFLVDHVTMSKIPGYVSDSCWEYRNYVFGGYSLEETKAIVNRIQKNNHKKALLYMDEHPYKRTTNLEYWVSKGYSPEDAKIKLMERQRTFTLDGLIKKHGEEEANRIYNERQQKWQDTLNSKPEEERRRMNKAKGKTKAYYIDKYGVEEGSYIWNRILKSRMLPLYSRFSKISQELFWSVYNSLPEQIRDKCQFAEFNGEKKVMVDYYKYYSLDFCIGNFCVEYNGETYHPRKDILSEEELISWKTPFSKPNYGKEKLYLDESRINYLTDCGFDITIVWDSDYRKDKEKFVRYIVTKIKEHLDGRTDQS